MRKSLLLLVCIASPAFAQLNRSAVSVNGSDSNTCAVSSPCRSFYAAYQQTSPGGEIIALNSGGYGTLNIYKSINIIAPPGVYAGVTVTTDNAYGFWIAAGASDRVVIRGVAINALPVSNPTPIYVYSGGSVSIENVVVDGGGGNCIAHLDGHVWVTDSTLRNCFSGIVSNVIAGATMVVNGVTIVNNTNGAFDAFGNATMTVRDSVAINGNAGFATGSNSGQASLNVENCAAINQTAGGGATVTSGGTLRISNSVLTNNIRGLWVNGGVLETFGNNEIRGNGTDIVGAPTSVPLD